MEIGDGYTIIYSGNMSTRNDVGVIVEKEIMKEDFKNGENNVEDDISNIIDCAYALQLGCMESQKEEFFWLEMDEVM